MNEELGFGVSSGYASAFLYGVFFSLEDGRFVRTPAGEFPTAIVRSDVIDDSPKGDQGAFEFCLAEQEREQLGILRERAVFRLE